MLFYLFGNIGCKITFMALLRFMGWIALPVMSNVFEHCFYAFVYRFKLTKKKTKVVTLKCQVYICRQLKLPKFWVSCVSQIY